MAMLPYLVEQPYSLALHYRHGLEELEGALEKLKPTHPVALFQADLRFETEVVELVETITAHFGRIDAVINLAGMSHGRISWKTTKEEWDEVLAVNLTAPFLMSKSVLPGMRERGVGRIINISSVVAQTGVVGTAAYAAAKAGLLGFTRSLSKEVASRGITVNAIALGYMDAGMIETITDDFRDDLLKRVPMERLGYPQELAALLIYLLSDQAAYVTGQTLNLNGGLYA